MLNSILHSPLSLSRQVRESLREIEFLQLQYPVILNSQKSVPFVTLSSSVFLPFPGNFQRFMTTVRTLNFGILHGENKWNLSMYKVSDIRISHESGQCNVM